MTWSPDGTQFAFTREITANVFQISRINADGTGETPLTSVGDNRYPAWSPDGTRIAFWSDRTSGIWVMNADGTGQTSLGGLAGTDRPSWSPDGAKLAFQRDGGLWTMNADGSNQAQLTAPSPQNVTDRNPAWSPDGQQIAFRGWTASPFSDGLIVINVDGTGRTTLSGPTGNRMPDWQPVANSYIRPKSAAPTRVPLVPAYDPCSVPNRTHGPPLAFDSCNPPSQTSPNLTVGTPDANGAPANAIGWAYAGVVVGTPGPPTDSAVKMGMSLTDVRCNNVSVVTCGSANSAGGADYTGELVFQVPLRISDRFNGTAPGGSSDPATMTDYTLSFSVPCAATASTAVGATCSAPVTDLNFYIPGISPEGKRDVWEVGMFDVLDGGIDGDGDTAADNTLFETQGLFVP
jgi:hypothetical protein